MQNIVDIKNRTKGIKQTSKITNAMEFISISKMRKANVKYQNNLNYYHKVRATIKDILMHTGGDVTHPYLKDDEGEKTAYVVIAGDKGLAGDYNSKILKTALEELSKHKQRYIFTIGHMTRDFFMRHKITPDVEFLNCAQNPTLDDARRITENLLYLYDNNIMDSVKIIYTQMLDTGMLNQVVQQLLPLRLNDFLDIETEVDYHAILDFEPSAEEVLNILVPQYVLGIVYSCLIQSVSSEHYERIKTMHSATDNANKIIKKLELEYNSARQELITTGINEISSSQLLDEKD